MIALFGLPGSSQFSFRRVATRAQGYAWFAAIVAANETQATLNARRQSRVLTNREAATLRWLDGSQIVSDETIAEADADEAIMAEHEARERACFSARGKLRCGECHYCLCRQNGIVVWDPVVGA